MTMIKTTIKELGEQGLIQLLSQYCSDAVGDDAAIAGMTTGDRQMVVTTDMLVDGVHFSDRTTSAEDVGWRAAAVNLSDLAAMGAEPWGLVMAVGLPADTTVPWIEGVYRGFRECLQTYGGELVGGDTVRSPIRTLSVTAFGQVANAQIIRRDRARVGDAIVITGAHGYSKAGLELLLNPDLAQNLEPNLVQEAKRHHQRPIPRFDAIAALQMITQEITQESAVPMISGMDSSDGLGDAIAQICRASGVGAKIDWDTLPIPIIVQSLAEDQARDWVLYGGEDFELVLFMPFEIANKFVKDLPTAMIIGQAIAPNPENPEISMASAFQHF
jgi:thiamine-monophosphate kinase